MTRAEILNCLTDRPCEVCKFHESGRCGRWDCVFEEKPDDCEDAISRQAVMCVLDEIGSDFDSPRNAVVSLDGVADAIQDLPSVTPKQNIGHCKDCRWWKDSDGSYRRGIGAESQCPINGRVVFEGNGYCYMYEPQESEVTDADSD